MGREQERLKRRLENNLIMECNKFRQRYCLGLFQDFVDTKDPRHLSYTDYSKKELLWILFYEKIAGIKSMQFMTYEFNEDRVVKNLFRFIGEEGREYLPHAVTVNEYLERLGSCEQQRLQQKQVYGLN